jgi:hypothetical protein
MVNHFSFAIVALSLGISLGLGYPPPPKESPKPEFDKLAKALGNSFVANAVKKDYDAIVKSVDVPYWSVDGKALDKPDAVKRELGEILPALLADGMKVAVKEVVTPEKFATWAEKLPVRPEASKTDAARNAFLERVGPGGRIVALQFEIDGKKDDDLCLLIVRFKDGKAVLVGLQD